MHHFNIFMNVTNLSSVPFQDITGIKKVNTTASQFVPTSTKLCYCVILCFNTGTTKALEVL